MEEQSAFKDFIEGKITEETFFSKKTDNAGRLSIDFEELDLLKNNMNLFRKFLLALSLKGRIRILLHYQLLGMTHESLTDKYGIPKDQLRVLKGQHDPKEKYKGEIRTIIKNNIPNDLYAALAIFTRLPEPWIREKVPNSFWSVAHFEKIADFLSLDEFLVYLNETEKKALKSKKEKHRRPNNQWVFDIRGVILQFNSKHKIYLRIAIYELGGFVIEVFSEKNEIYDFIILQEILLGFGPIQTGYFETIIKKRLNPVIICKSRSQILNTPIELKPFITL
ncbi:hypothetical protein ABE41_015075 [Fictibacillus arsenicus]|uniref:Uncharacterized protein n=1 Tax=Fictibacillus arsenicus TaxID=255247 RepID=A0A1B1Z7L9_9BACL|nr:hypothetical protein [Fictibacillus arsenicus]ANX13329.1 hypothetical protein ABE41_015075 [Fictibacillus arsenicus]